MHRLRNGVICCQADTCPRIVFACDHSFGVASPTVQVQNVKLATLVTCVGGAHDTGRHIVNYSRQRDADVLLLGSRGMGSFSRAMLGFLGLGSVSDYGAVLACDG